MRIFNQKLMGSVVGLMLGGMTVTANAQSCWFLGYDVVRTEEFIVTGAERESWIDSEKNKINAKEDEIQILENKKGFKKKQLLASPSYDYMSGVGCSRMGSNQIFDVGSAQDVGSIKKTIYDKFFIKPDDNQVTQAMRNEIVIRRHNYLRELSQEVLSLSYGYRESIAEELDRLSKAPTEAKGNIQQIELMAQTKKTMVEEKAAELLFQAKLMELDAAQMLLGVEQQYTCDSRTGKDNTDWTEECKKRSSSGSGK